MSRTAKWEHPSDTIRQTYREWRKARPAGRDAAAFAADLLLDAEEVAA